MRFSELTGAVFAAAASTVVAKEMPRDAAKAAGENARSYPLHFPIQPRAFLTDCFRTLRQRQGSPEPHREEVGLVERRSRVWCPQLLPVASSRLHPLCRRLC